jgi:cell division protein ZapA (FtsZ GTPase activity inhibitor)
MKLIRGFFIILVLLVLLAAAFLVYHQLDENEIGVVLEKDTRTTVDVFRNSRNAVWQGLFFWNYDIAKLPLRHSFTREIEVPLPGLETFDNDLYAISFEVLAVYAVDRQNFADFSLLEAKADPLDDRIGDILAGAYARAMREYLYPLYRPEELRDSFTGIHESVRPLVEARLAELNVSLDSLELNSLPVVPGMNVFSEGLQHRRELRQIELDNELKTSRFQQRVAQEQTRYEQYRAHLRKLSDIIEENRDILKYIYIDKFSGDSKVEIPLSDTGMPSFFRDGTEKPRPEPRKAPSGDLDNFKYD